MHVDRRRRSSRRHACISASLVTALSASRIARRHDPPGYRPWRRSSPSQSQPAASFSSGPPAASRARSSPSICLAQHQQKAPSSLITTFSLSLLISLFGYQLSQPKMKKGSNGETERKFSVPAPIANANANASMHLSRSHRVGVDSFPAAIAHMCFFLRAHACKAARQGPNTTLLLGPWELTLPICLIALRQAMHASWSFFHQKSTSSTR